MIHVFDSLLPEEICVKWIDRVKTLKKSEDFATEIFQTIKGLLDGEFPVPITGCRPEVSIGKSSLPIKEHYDEQLGREKWKLFCYLNAVKNGGTDFYNGTEWNTVEAKLGTVVLFDISLLHRGQPDQERKPKYTVGIRLES